MVSGTILVTGAIIALASQASAHASIWLESMFGFNETSGNNRPVDPLMNRTFNDWWFHGHTHLEPNPGDVAQLPVGGTHTFEISCDKDSTSYWPTGPGGDRRDLNNPDYPCPGQPTTEFHTNGINDLGGCALGVAYQSDITKVKPDEITIFSVNQTCVWHLFTDFQIPALMPQCPDGGCICAWFWIHRADSGSEQMYMTGFRCNMTGAVSTTPLPPPQVPRRCGPDPDGSPYDPANCTLGPKQPLYWFQADGNNMFEGTYEPPLYTDKYHFLDGPQDDIFQPSNSSTNSSTQPSGSTISPVPPSTPVAVGLPVPSSSSPAPLPSSSSLSSPSSYPPAPPSSSPSSYPSDPQPSVSRPPSCSHSSGPQPSPLPSSYMPAGNVSPSDTPPTPSTPSSDSDPYQPSDTPPTPSTPSSDSDQPSQPPSPVPSPTDENDPEHTSKPKSKSKCKHGSKSPKPSSAYRRDESDHVPRANPPAHRRLSSIGDAPARRIWGHRHRGIEKRDT